MLKHPEYINQIVGASMRSAETSMITAYLPVIRQIMRFGIVGLTAATIHFSIVVMLVQFAGLQPLVANVFGFLISFQVGYWGHRTWTFNGTSVLHREALPRLLTVQVVAFTANETLFYTFLQMHLPYQVALLIVLTILPIFTFLMSKLWVFK